MGSLRSLVLLHCLSLAALLFAISVLKSYLCEGSVARPPGSLVALLKNNSAGLPWPLHRCKLLELAMAAFTSCFSSRAWLIACLARFTHASLSPFD